MKINSSKWWTRLFIYVLVLSLMAFTITFLRSRGGATNNVFVPVGFIAIFISFYIFKEYNRVQKVKREERREYMNERRQELLDRVLKKNKENADNIELKEDPGS